MKPFKPTFLYVKQHLVTKMKYFGMTHSKDPLTYLGSGKYWKHHINAHGREHVKTVWHRLFTNKEDLKEFATFFSEEMDIVNSKEWANLIPEDGTGSAGNTGKSASEATRKLWSEQRKGYVPKAESIAKGIATKIANGIPLCGDRSKVIVVGHTNPPDAYKKMWETRKRKQLEHLPASN